MFNTSSAPDAATAARASGAGSRADRSRLARHQHRDGGKTDAPREDPRRRRAGSLKPTAEPKPQRVAAQSKHSFGLGPGQACSTACATARPGQAGRGRQGGAGREACACREGRIARQAARKARRHAAASHKWPAPPRHNRRRRRPPASLKSAPAYSGTTTGSGGGLLAGAQPVVPAGSFNSFR